MTESTVDSYRKQGITSVRAMQMLEDYKEWGRLIDSDPHLKGYFDGTMELVRMSPKVEPTFFLAKKPYKERGEKQCMLGE